MTVRAIPWAEALRRAEATGDRLRSRRATERLPLAEAIGRVLAAPLLAVQDSPSFDRSAMDGWAVVGDPPWRVVPDGVPPAGSAVPLATGSRVPPNALVVRSERAEALGGTLTVSGTLVAGEDLRRRGEEFTAGAELVPAGAVLTPLAAAVAASGGIDEVDCVAVPTVALLVLGDELDSVGVPQSGRVRDSLGMLVSYTLAGFGLPAVRPQRIPDRREALGSAIASAAADAPTLVVTTGGTGGGPSDHLVPVLEACGAVRVIDTVQVRPGHPLQMAELQGGTVVLGLPGNPFAAFAGLRGIGAALIHASLGMRQPATRWAPIDIGFDTIDGAATRLVAVTQANGVATPVARQGAGMLLGASRATALAIVPPGGVSAGERVELIAI